VGIFAVQIAKSYGAQVTAVCGARNLEMARSLGADKVVDYRREDFTRSGEQYDLILAVNGHHSLRDYRRALRPAGVCVVVGGPLSQVLQAAALGRFLSRPGGKKHLFFVAATPKQDLLALRDLLAAGKLVAVIDKTYPLSKAAEAIRYVMDEHARGKVIITAGAQA
jgi:NADPH:quinone reductase-like Zn-dependent oxidoreductase